MNSRQRSEIVRQCALQAGFDAVGFARPDPPQRAAYYTAWIDAGRHGAMHYLARNAQIRRNPAEIMPGCRSVVCLALSYHRPHAYPPPDNAPRAAADSGKLGRIAMYALGEDYHVVMRRRLETLTGLIRAAVTEPAEFRPCVDTAPVIERELAALAGLGWIGKNTLVLSAALGSYFVLGELFTTLDLAPDPPATDHCGTCTRCLDACPTDAFPAAYEMDAQRCISYYTIEHRGDVPPEIAGRLGDWVFGCDECQRVCPFNRKAPPGTAPELMQDRVPAQIPLDQLAALTAGGYRRLTRGSAMRRATRRMLQRNAQLAQHRGP